MEKYIDAVVDFIMDRYEEDKVGFLIKVMAYSFITGSMIAVVSYFI